ncbi:hypothetical protein [Nitratireductor arenosus]|uniref:hypothetical protein n=1 Tax=Nitratireductor arenosus TaxID=2682096 RepID=UPI0018D2210B|nr:hypothetical protein [Nitratireductor arenosus]
MRAIELSAEFRIEGVHFELSAEDILKPATQSLCDTLPEKGYLLELGMVEKTHVDVVEMIGKITGAEGFTDKLGVFADIVAELKEIDVKLLAKPRALKIVARFDSITVKMFGVSKEVKDAQIIIVKKKGKKATVCISGHVEGVFWCYCGTKWKKPRKPPRRKPDDKGDGGGGGGGPPPPPGDDDDEDDEDDEDSSGGSSSGKDEPVDGKYPWVLGKSNLGVDTWLPDTRKK